MRPSKTLRLFLIIALLILTSCNINELPAHEPREGFFGTFGEVRAMATREDYDQVVSLVLRSSYSHEMRLRGAFHIGVTGRQILDAADGIAPHIHTDIVFVHSFEEILDHPEGVLVLWPGEMSRGVLFGMNWLIARDGIDVEQFSLSYPLTIDNMVYNWEEFNGVFSRGLDNIHRMIITQRFWDFVDEAAAEEKARRNLSPQDEELWQQLAFALNMSFQHNVEGMRIMDMKRALENGEHNFTGIAVVHSSDEAINYPDDIVVFWPSELTELVVFVLNEYHTTPVWTSLNLEDFSLTLPITTESLVDGWENVFSFWMELGLADSIKSLTAFRLQDLKISQIEHFRELEDDE